MATATVDLKEHVSCPVCLDIYNDPKILKCLHTICNSCLKNICKLNRVVCPVCRTVSQENQVQSDFKTRSLVETYRGKNPQVSKAVSGSGEKVLHPCQICRINEVTSYCCDCKKLVCVSCKLHHIRIPACENHTFGFHTFRQDQAAELQAEVSGLEMYGIGNPAEHRQFEAKMQAMENKAISEIQEAEKVALAQVRAHHQSLISRVQETKFNQLRNRQQHKHALKEKAWELEAKVEDRAKQLKESGEGSGANLTVTEILQDLTHIEALRDEITVLKTQYSVDKCASRITMSVSKGTYGPETGTKLTIRNRAGCSIQ